MAKTCYQYVRDCRTLLRDDTYPEGDIIDALNRVIRDINVMGPFRFHQGTYSLNLTANNYTYPVPANVQFERLFLFAAGDANNAAEVLHRPIHWGELPVIPSETGDVPSDWSRYENNWYIRPIPNATMAAQNITVFYDKDLTELLSPMDTIALPDRHANVLIYGAVAQLRPNLIIASQEGDQKVYVLAQKAIANMINKEKFDFNSILRMKAGPRFKHMSSWGHDYGIRGYSGRASANNETLGI